MRRMLSLAILALTIGLLPARAGDAPKASRPEPGTSVEMPILVAPMLADGTLVSYAYVSNTIVATSPAATIDVRAHTPFIQDAYVRDMNATPLAAGDDQAEPIDKKALAARLLAIAGRIVGSDKVASVKLTQIQISLVQSPGG